MSLQIVNKTRFFIFLGTLLALVAVLVFSSIRLLRKDSGKQESLETLVVFEALIQPVDQQSPSIAGKSPSALEKGDVIAVFPEGHSWSETERTSYLILKLRSKKEDLEKLLEPLRKETQERDKGNGSGIQQKTIRARKYRVRLENLDFDLQKFWGNPVQPYPDQVFDGSLIEEKSKDNLPNV